jgi:hypothetical protein
MAIGRPALRGADQCLEQTLAGRAQPMSLWESGRESGSAAVVIPQHAAQSLATRDLAGCASHLVAWFDEPIVKP